jgi:uncharacterized membrane protein YjfL (UPF0719 family)
MPLRGWLSTISRMRRAEAIPMLSAKALAVITVVTTLFVTLRVFARLTPEIDEFHEVRTGNTTVAIVLAGVVVVVSMFMQVGTSAIAGALIPQTPLGEVRIMK